MYGNRPPLPPTPPRSPAVQAQTYGPASAFRNRTPAFDPFSDDRLAPREWIPYSPAAKASLFFSKSSENVEYRLKIDEEKKRLSREQELTRGGEVNLFTPPIKNRIQRVPAPPMHPLPTKLPLTEKVPLLTKIPLETSSSILVHSGFWQILSSTGSRFYNTPTNSPERVIDNGRLVFNGEERRASTNPETGITKKKVSVGMIGAPRDYRHLVHASDAEQLNGLMTRWSLDGVGKLGEPSWAHPIKEASRARTRAKSIARIQEVRENRGPLKVMNGISSSIITTKAVEIDDGSEELERPGLKRSESSESIIIHEAKSDGEPFSRADDLLFVSRTAPSSVVPSLATMEKTVSAKVYFETFYHGILKKESARNQRLNQLDQELLSSNLNSSQKLSIRAAYVEAETSHLRYLRSRVDINSFVKLKVIGHGAFGVVSIVRGNHDGIIYAMKQLRKSTMLMKSQEGHVRAERDLLERAEGMTRWCTRLIYSFQDPENLYLVMEYMGGGDLLNLLIERDTFSEEFSQFYIAEMILAIEETHKKLGAIHRDIKPDNFLISNSGHIRIADFGLATDHEWSHSAAYYDSQRRELFGKHGIDLGNLRAPPTKQFDEGKVDAKEGIGSILTIRERHRRKKAYSVVGTNNYMSVEVLRGQGYTESCDWWSLGCILYECVIGYPPFVSKSRQATRVKIQNWKTNLRFPASPKISKDCQDLITSLICEEEDRIGFSGEIKSRPELARPNSILVQNRSPIKKSVPTKNLKYGGLIGAEAIKAHPWFRGIDFETLHLQTPPFVPELDSPFDTKYFEENVDPNPLPAFGEKVGEEETTLDTLLSGKHGHGEELLRLRKDFAFSGWTFKGRAPSKVYDPRVGFKNSAETTQISPSRGRSKLRSDSGSNLVRSLSV